MTCHVTEYTIPNTIFYKHSQFVPFCISNMATCSNSHTVFGIPIFTTTKHQTKGGKNMQTNLIGTTNVGYTIIKQGEKAVIAQDLTAPDMYVTWSYRIQDGQPDYFWGRYVSSYDTALLKFSQKEGEM